MIQQKIFPFKLEMTEDKLTSKAGLSILQNITVLWV